ncbi:hypothetical protein ACFPOU_22445 [Massilia jejuensis]|uniref:Uncharacterized protein n=1 Tax=Massilia jejuensis TaxID=648894 RepID=A0ABW0PQA0_9BURK
MQYTRQSVDPGRFGKASPESVAHPARLRVSFLFFLSGNLSGDS